MLSRKADPRVFRQLSRKKQYLHKTIIPEQAAYDLAEAIGENHGKLKWFIRIYTYDQETAWRNFGIPRIQAPKNITGKRDT